jgi:ferredoxin-type protein NapH
MKTIAAVPARQRLRRILLLTSLLLFPLTFNYYSPALPVYGALERVASFSLVFWAAWAVAGLVLGRAACGWICPVGALQELWDAAAGRRKVGAGRVGRLRWLLCAAWLAVIAWAVWRGGGLVRFDPLYKTERVVSWDDVHGAYVYVGMFGLGTLLALALGKRGFCRALCWWAPLNTAAPRVGAALGLPVLRLQAAPKRCSGCRRCEEACPVGLPVSAMVRSGTPGAAECVLCGSCVDGCRTGAVKYAGLPHVRHPVDPEMRPTLSWRRRCGSKVRVRLERDLGPGDRCLSANARVFGVHSEGEALHQRGGPVPGGVHRS